MEAHIFGETVVVGLGPLPVTATVLTSLAISLLLVAAAAWLAWCARRAPGSAPAVLALVAVQWFEQLVRDVTGRAEPALVALCGSLFLFIAACNLSGQLGGELLPRPLGQSISLRATGRRPCTALYVPESPISRIRASGDEQLEALPC